MTAAIDVASMTWGSGFQPPAIMSEMSSASASSAAPVVNWRRFRSQAADPRSKVVTLTDRFVPLLDPGHRLAHELFKKTKQALADLQAYRSRIEELRDDAAQDGYGLNAASERDSWYFIRSEPFCARAVWF